MVKNATSTLNVVLMEKQMSIQLQNWKVLQNNPEIHCMVWRRKHGQKHTNFDKSQWRSVH
jgi:hypothetical protein